MAADNYYWLTKLVLNFTGADNSTTFTDISPTPKTPSTVAGNAKITSNALALDGSGDYVTYAQDAGFDIGASDDFCIELDWTPTTAGSSGSGEVLLHYGATTFATNTDLALYMVYGGTGFTGKLRCTLYNGTTGYSVDSLAAAVAGTKYRIAWARTSGLIALYVNGVQQNTVSGAVAANTPSGRILDIGRFVAADPRYANGSIDRVRLTKGASRYTTSYTPDTSDWEASSPATVNGAMTAPMGTLLSLGAGISSLQGPMGTLVTHTGATFNGTAPSPRLDSVSHDSTGERAFNGIAPMGQLVARTGATASMQAPSGVLVASVTVPISVRAELTGPAGSLVSSSTVAVMVRADLRLSRAGTLVATTGAQARMEGPMGSMRAIATAGVLARFAGSVPMGELNAMMTAGIVVRAQLTSPKIQPSARASARLVAPMGRLTAIASAVVSVTYEAYAINLLPGEGMPHQVTRYTNFPFNQIVRFQGNYYGVAADGLYLLGGDTDYDASAPAKPAWSFHTGITDFGSRQVKGARETIVGGRLGPSVTASVSVGEAADQTYGAAIVAGFGAKNYRVKYGKGLNARYWSFGFADPAGSDVNIDTLEFDVRETSRKL